MQNLTAFKLAFEKQKKKKFYPKKQNNLYQLTHTTKGTIAENKARRYLEQQGLIYLESNIACPFGEIDLLMKEGTELVIVEVKQRNTHLYGHATESLHYQKQQKIIRTLLYALPSISTHLFNGKIPKYRFDLVSIERNKIQWTKNAFLKSSSDR